MDANRAAMLAAKIDAAYPANNISDTTIMLWAEVLMEHSDAEADRIVTRVLTDAFYADRPPSIPALHALARSLAPTIQSPRLGEGIEADLEEAARVKAEVFARLKKLNWPKVAP